MADPIYIEVHGNPKPKKRPRFKRIGKGVRTYNPSHDDEELFMMEVYNQLGTIEPMLGPIHMDVTFVMKRPKSHFGTGRNEDKLKETAPRFHIVKPDKDNLEKFVMDALDGYLWKDDAQVTRGETWKRYASEGEATRTIIIIYEVEEG